jgi:hypothetical protein
MKSGTSWWYSLVVSHPDVVDVPQRAKEVHFFDRHFWEPRPAADYHAYFPRPVGSLVGEWTPRYLYDFWVPPLLEEAAPGARLLVLLRDPVERFVSGLAHDLSRGSLPLPPLLHDHFSRGLYAEQLERLFRHIAREQVLVLGYERCVTDPLSAVAETYEFLGLDPAFVPPRAAERVHETVGPKPTVTEGFRSLLVDAYQSSVEDLRGLLPGFDTDSWTALR